MTWVLADAACIAELEKIEKDKGEETTLGEIATEFTMERADADVTNLDLRLVYTGSEEQAEDVDESSSGEDDDSDEN